MCQRKYRIIAVVAFDMLIAGLAVFLYISIYRSAVEWNESANKTLCTVTDGIIEKTECHNYDFGGKKRNFEPSGCCSGTINVSYFNTTGSISIAQVEPCSNVEDMVATTYKVGNILKCWYLNGELRLSPKNTVGCLVVIILMLVIIGSGSIIHITLEGIYGGKNPNYEELV